MGLTVTFEVEVIGAVTEYRSHALANGRVVFTQVEDTGGTGGIGWQAYYPLRDHLGSVDKQYVAMGAGTNPLVYSYDAYGRRRSADWNNDGSGSQMAPSLWNRRGYTDHEMLDTAQLVHMQGRVYDPSLGRFLSPDPVLGRLGSPQSLNPYSYVANNPLSATDPSGYSSASVMADSFSASSIDLIANGALLDLEVAIANYTSTLNGWVNACKASPASCGGGDFPMPGAVTSAAQGAVTASTLALNFITNDLITKDQQREAALNAWYEKNHERWKAAQAEKVSIEFASIFGFSPTMFGGWGGAEVDQNAPGSVSISGSENMGFYSIYHYQLRNLNGAPLTGPGYYMAEFISPPDVSINNNGVYLPLNNGQLDDRVGFLSQPMVPANTVTTQRFSVLYNGYFYHLSTVFQHQNISSPSYSNGSVTYHVTNTVTVIHP